MAASRREDEERTARTPLTRERLLREAMALADARGVGALTMRSLAEALGVTPMSLYHHVAGKEEILDGIVDLVFSSIELPVADGGWRAAMRRRAVSTREVLARHPWAVALMDSRAAPGPATLRHHDAALGVLRGAGVSVELAGHAIALLDAYVYGFVIQEAALPVDDDGTDIADLAEALVDQLPAGAYPHLVELATERVLSPGYSFAAEFDFGLDLILDGLERAAGV